jgi:hypothetical protein
MICAGICRRIGGRKGHEFYLFSLILLFASYLPGFAKSKSLLNSLSPANDKAG